MKASVIIPVWNGEAVLGQCLEALFAHSEEASIEVICVDNASEDGSADVTARFPQVHWLKQPVNLGFAGGVNAGASAARGEILLLLNQDCLIHEGWLTTVSAAFAHDKAIGIVGGTLYDPDGAIDHAGGHISKPAGYGVHATVLPPGSGPHSVEYVTGALFAIRRSTWESVGSFDDAFYPGYFEESDYCYRAREQGFETVYVQALQATHLRSSRAWQADPIKHGANQHRSRYRFVAKHFSTVELNAFFAAENEAISREDTHIHQNIARLLGQRDTLRTLPEIAARRSRDLELSPGPAHERLLSAGFSQLLRHTWSHLQQANASAKQFQTTLQASREKLERLKAQEYELISRIYFRHPRADQPESRLRRLWRLLILRPLSIITLREFFLLSKLNTLHVARLDQLSDMQHLLEEQIGQRLELLEYLTEYEYR